MAGAQMFAERPDSAIGPVAATAPTTSGNRRWFKHLRAISALLGARGFCLMTVLSGVGALRLVPVIDSGQPMPLPASHWSGREAERFARAALAATTPALWAPSPSSSTDGTRPRWTRTIASPAPGSRGIVFPVPTERGGGGLAMFADPRHLTDETIPQAHMECFELFKSVCGVEPAGLAGQAPLSKRELECLRLTADGLTSQEIAGRLGLSVHTANQYLANTTQKLNAVNRMHAVAKALRTGLFD
jgi:DNA-binding CsgD family transcriptional regulator